MEVPESYTDDTEKAMIEKDDKNIDTDALDVDIRHENTKETDGSENIPTSSEKANDCHCVGTKTTCIENVDLNTVASETDIIISELCDLQVSEVAESSKSDESSNSEDANKIDQEAEATETVASGSDNIISGLCDLQISEFLESSKPEASKDDNEIDEEAKALDLEAISVECEGSNTDDESYRTCSTENFHSADDLDTTEEDEEIQEEKKEDDEEETQEEEEDIDDDVYDDICKDMFSDCTTHIPRTPCQQQLLIPEDELDERNALQHFAQEFRLRFGECHPFFYIGSLKDALEYSFKCPIDKKKLLAIYLHHDDLDCCANVFCSQILCNPEFVTFVANNCTIWAWDLTAESNAQRWMSFYQDNLEAGDQRQEMEAIVSNTKGLPLLMLVSENFGTYEIRNFLTGKNSFDEAMNAVIDAHLQFMSDIRVEINMLVGEDQASSDHPTHSHDCGGGANSQRASIQEKLRDPWL